MAKSRFMILMDDGHGSTIDCTSNTTEGSIKETKNLIPDGIAFIVVQVKSECLMYRETKERVLTTGDNDGKNKEETSVKKEDGKEDCKEIGSQKDQGEESGKTESPDNENGGGLTANEGLVYTAS